jgi:endonuclease III
MGVEAERDVWKDMVEAKEDEKDFSFQIFQALSNNKLSKDSVLKRVTPEVCRKFSSIESIVTRPAAVVKIELLDILRKLGLQDRKSDDIIIAAHQLVLFFFEPEEEPPPKQPQKKKKKTKPVPILCQGTTVRTEQQRPT